MAVIWRLDFDLKNNCLGFLARLLDYSFGGMERPLDSGRVVSSDIGEAWMSSCQVVVNDFVSSPYATTNSSMN